MRGESGGEEPDLIEPEDSSAAQAEDAKFECTRDSSSTQPRRLEPGQPGKASAVRRATSIRGNPKISRPATPKGLVFRATWKLAHRRAQGSEDSGQPGDSPLAKPEGAKPGATREAASRCRKIPTAGQPAERIIGDTERPGVGATRFQASRHRRRMRVSGQLETPSPAKPEMRARGNPGAHQRRCKEA